MTTTKSLVTYQKKKKECQICEEGSQTIQEKKRRMAAQKGVEGETQKAVRGENGCQYSRKKKDCEFFLRGGVRAWVGGAGK